MIIAIDGPAASGKSTAARMLAEELGMDRLNTGAMYRATAFALMQSGYDIITEQRDSAAIAAFVQTLHFDMAEGRTRVNGNDVTDQLQQEEIGRAASRVATFSEVREHLKAEQRRIAKDRDMICEGRDQGTVVFPDALVKFFFTASPEVRAKRRAAEEKLPTTALPTLVQAIIDRDRQDSQRPIDPLVQASDAVLIDTTDLEPEEMLQQLLTVINARQSNR